MAWIIDFRGDLSESSELNMDGSTSMRAVSVVYGADIAAALTNLLTYTKKRGITLTSVSRCLELSTFIPTEEIGYTSKEVTNALKELTSESLVVFAFAISSEAEDDEAIEIGAGR
jgi:hypothetical protein